MRQELRWKAHRRVAAHERALVALYEQGVPFRTQYDKPGDPLSLDYTMNLTVLDPLAEPMIHKAFPGGIADLREYVMEISASAATTRGARVS